MTGDIKGGAEGHEEDPPHDDGIELLPDWTKPVTEKDDAYVWGSPPLFLFRTHVLAVETVYRMT